MNSSIIALLNSKYYYYSLLIIFLGSIINSCSVKTQDSLPKTYTLQHNELTREYIYYAPDNLAKNAPLVVVLHGFTSSAEKIMNYTKFNTIADHQNFAVLYPQGTIDKDGNTFWNVGYAFHKNSTIDDVDYISKLVQHVQQKYHLSASNTFLTGMSNGGEMSYLMGCQYPELFSAIAPVAGIMLESFFEKCKTHNPIPVLAIFGTDDKTTRYNGDIHNEDGWGAYVSVPTTLNHWVEKINHSKVTTDTIANSNTSDGSYVIRERFTSNQHTNELIYFKVVNGGHDWPGAWGNMDISTSQEIWSFFKTYVK